MSKRRRSDIITQDDTVKVGFTPANTISARNSKIMYAKIAFADWKKFTQDPHCCFAYSNKSCIGDVFQIDLPEINKDACNAPGTLFDTLVPTSRILDVELESIMSNYRKFDYDI